MTAPIDPATTVTPLDAASRLASDATTSPAGRSVKSSAVAAVATPAPSPPTVSSPESLTQLVVEPGKGAQPYIYKLVDRSTGEVLSELPREVANTLATTPSYTAGAVVDESV